MRQEPLVFGLMVLGVVVGLLVLLVGEATHGNELFVPIGGGVVLLSVGAMTGFIALLD